MNNSKNVLNYMFGKNAIDNLNIILKNVHSSTDYVIYFIDEFFQNQELLNRLPVEDKDKIIFVQTKDEPKTTDIDKHKEFLVSIDKAQPKAIIAVGGGCTLDTGKAVANLLTNTGKAEEYQGWDLVKNPGVYKIGIPTLSGTGAEASRTCVLTNVKNGLKLGMNSDHTIYDQLILDPELTRSVPREQYFYSGMDTYIHCIESLNGNFRNAIGDSFSLQALALCREVFLDKEMMSDKNREKLMVASYLGGCAIANSYVGVIHPFSAGLSVVLGVHHCIGNCITLNAMEEFYPKEYHEFQIMLNQQEIELPKIINENIDNQIYTKLYDATIIHEKPLLNALGENFKDSSLHKRQKKSLQGCNNEF